MNYKALASKKNPFEGLSLDEKRRLVVYLGYVAVPPVPMDEIKRRWGAVLKDDECPTAFEALEMVEIIKREVLAEENIEKEASNNSNSGYFARLAFGLFCVIVGIALGILAYPYLQQKSNSNVGKAIPKPTQKQAMPPKPVTPPPPKTGQTATITLPGGEKMEMIYCGPGTFLMGSPVSESGRGDNETQHRVTLTKGFWLGKYKVTQAQWESIMGTNPSSEKGFDLPVEGVSWLECFSFAEKINAILNCGVRMPTESEWEYACRAGTQTTYSTTDKESADINSVNSWGFSGMNRGAMEWCFDEYIGDYSARSVIDPQAGKRSANDVNATFILRGGTRVIKCPGHYDNRDKCCASRPANRMSSFANKKKVYYHFAEAYPDGSGGGFYSDSAQPKPYGNDRVVDFPFGFRLYCSRLPDK